ncbi:MAG: helix-turn-helix transcriptional regulator, partial [Cyanobacteriota bacterium]|nr:helix-turn-helix transcriptional regulator [Cyanobacteriota bacterium]
MNPSLTSDFSPQLHQLMQQAGLSTLDELSQIAGVSRWQIIRMRRGLARQMRVEVLLKISQGLKISLIELLAIFDPESVSASDNQTINSAVEELQQEYQRLQTQIQQQRESLSEEFQRGSLETLESWL